LRAVTLWDIPRKMNIALLQLNPVVGDLPGNAARMAEAVKKAAALGADLCLTPEMALLGYPPRDLLLYGATLRRTREAAENLAAELAGLPPVLAGGVEPNPSSEGRGAFNCAFLLRGGRVERSFRKTLLPTYDVFDEDRYFEPSAPGFDNFFELNGRTVAVTICEDLWNDAGFWPRPRYHADPVKEILRRRPDLLVNLSASPFSLGKQVLRQSMLGAVAQKLGRPLAYANQTGGNDDLVFDGRSCAFGPDGALLARAKGFEEDLLLVDLDGGGSRIEEDDFEAESETWRALVLGTRDYIRKNGFSKALLGLSGGIDSALTAAVAAEAVGPENVTGVLMPSPFSSRGSIDDSLLLARNLGIKTLTLPIAPLMDGFSAALKEPFAGLAEDTTEENLQSRIRGNLLMALSNKTGAILLTTGNKSELAVGYCTIYGDMSGGFAVISDLPKTAVYRLARWLNATRGEVIPEAVLTKAPSAELKPGQTDQDSLPPYEVLDAILALHVEGCKSGEEIAAAGFDRATVERVLKLVAGAEFKRRQAAPGIKLTDRSFGTGWRMPLACRRLP